ncbi:uncharacterized protein E5676_scaffold110G00070 [Cucumis melo var. makuwa]|uniref:Uncharacterized protein n=1 Tax=Cucumis melo var. makuwa TaxID=1194695 RepID=A0A5A7VC49_CUCMM|nr:uncharacterized protein E6C27_scaffold977G00640 [Cucumis melo var. makuwa]TYJ95751.1 uncharacterized protein E5676_scaffold110G00070 [Cucumis melo var. makuwa]
MNQLGISIEESSSSKLVIQGFNQGAQRAIDIVRVEIAIKDLQGSTIFHVINSRTTYKLLLRRPWIHENEVVTSTLHQCFKFYKLRIRKVDADTKPFSKVESHFADVKFYTRSDDVSEVISTEVPMAKGTYKLEQRTITTKKSNERDALNGRENDEPMTQAEVPENEKWKSHKKKSQNSLFYAIFLYLDVRRKNHHLLNVLKNLMVRSIEILKESFTTPLTKMDKGEFKRIAKEGLESFLPEK